MSIRTANDFVTTHVTVDFKTLANLLCTATETSAISYWAEVVRVNKPSEYRWLSSPDLNDGKPFPHIDAIFNGGSLVIAEHEAATEKDGTPKHTLTLAKLSKGLSIMAEKYGKHFGDILSENDDAETADALVQLSLFGEIIYG